MKIRTQPQIEIRRHSRRYVSVCIDLWPTPWNLSREGQDVVRAILLDAARRTFALGRRSTREIFFGAGSTCIDITAVDRRIADEILRELLAVVQNAAFRVPIRP